MCGLSALDFACMEQLRFPRDRRTSGACAFGEDLAEVSEILGARPVALKLSGHRQPSDGLGTLDIGAVNGFMIWKDVLNTLENQAATLFRHCCQDRRDAVGLRRHGKTNGVVYDHRWLVAVDIRELERLVIDQHNHAIIRCEKRIESDLCKCSHTSVPS